MYFPRDPNSFTPNGSSSEPRNSRNENEKDESAYWDSYDTINQFYLELGKRIEYVIQIRMTYKMVYTLFGSLNY